MEFENHNIECNTFWDVERVIKKAETKIKEPRSAAEKQYYAQDILLEAETLLSCLDYDAKNSDCTTCRSFAYRYAQEYKYLTRAKRKKVIKRY